MLEFLQDRFTAGLAPSTLKVYVAVISAYHIPLGGMYMEKDPLVSRFLLGTLRLRPAARTRVPTWDLAIVLQGLSLAPFEPLEEEPAKFLTLKALFLRYSCPPSHHWISLWFHFAGLNPISLVGLSGWPGAGRYLKHINWSLGFPRARFLDPSSSPHTLHHWLPSYRHMASPTISMLMTHSSISHFDQMIQR